MILQGEKTSNLGGREIVQFMVSRLKMSILAVINLLGLLDDPAGFSIPTMMARLGKSNLVIADCQISRIFCSTMIHMVG